MPGADAGLRQSVSLQEEGAGPAAAAPHRPCPTWGTPGEAAAGAEPQGGLPRPQGPELFGVVGYSHPCTVLALHPGVSSGHQWNMAECHLPHCCNHTAPEHRFEISSHCLPRASCKAASSCPAPCCCQPQPAPGSPPPAFSDSRGGSSPSAEPCFPQHGGPVAGQSGSFWMSGSSHLPQRSPTASLWQHLPKHRASEHCCTHREQLHSSMQRQVCLLPQGGRMIRSVFFAYTARIQLLLHLKTSQGSASLPGTHRDQRGKSSLCPNTAAACYQFS